MDQTKIALLILLGILFLVSVSLVAVGIHTSNTLTIVWNAINMFVSAFFFGFTYRLE